MVQCLDGLKHLCVAVVNCMIPNSMSSPGAWKILKLLQVKHFVRHLLFFTVQHSGNHLKDCYNNNNLHVYLDTFSGIFEIIYDFFVFFHFLIGNCHMD